MTGSAGGLRAAVREATDRLSLAGIASPEADALTLAAHALGTSTAEVRKAMVLGGDVPETFAELVEQRAGRVPLQHLTGEAGFRRLVLRVGPGVFVPRPETEVLAGLVIDAARAAGPHPVVVDLCTGSGAIALSVKDEVPGARVLAVELSEDAHAWAALNLERTALEVTLRRGDAARAFPELDGQVDVVACNPPYIPLGAVPLDPEVRDHDPALALYGGSADGLAVPRQMAARAARLLRPGGVLVMEHADSQGSTLPRALLGTGEWGTVLDHTDLVGRPRCTVATRGGGRGGVTGGPSATGDAAI